MHLRQLRSGLGMQVIAEPQKLLASDRLPRLQTQPLDALTDPVTGLCLLLRVIIVVRQMLIEIGRRSVPVLLWFSREHGVNPRPSSDLKTAKKLRASQPSNQQNRERHQPRSK